MKIFITGGTGFIGRHVVRLLEKQGHELLLLTRDRKNNSSIFNFSVNFIDGDLNKINELEPKLKEFSPDAIIHLAWEGLPDYSKDMCEKNFLASRELFFLAKKIKCSCVISTGSCWEYLNPIGKINERAELDMKTFFPLTKNCLKNLGELLFQEQELSFYWLRLFYVYGIGQRQSSLIPSIIKTVINNEIPDIKTPENKNDFIDVKDVAIAIANLLEKKPDSTIYNIGSGFSTSVLDIMKNIYKIMGKSFDESLFNKTAKTQDFYADISKINEHIEWSPSYNLEQGISEVIKEIKEGLK